MSSLLDLAPLRRSVHLRGKDIEFHGITAEGLVVLLERFPELKKLLQSQESITAETIGKLGPKLLAAAIAHAHAVDGEETMQDDQLRKVRGKLEKAALGLNLGEQLDVIRAVIEVTFPTGIGPFVREVMALGAIAPAPQPVASTNGASAGTGKAAATKSESQSSPL